MQIPKLIDHNHIQDSIVEIRFNVEKESDFFIEDLSALKSFYPGAKYVPSDIPFSLKKTDINLKHHPDGTILCGDYSIGLSFNSISFNCIEGYKSWNLFSGFISDCFELINSLKTNTVKTVSRVGTRYVNFFEGVNELVRITNFSVNLPVSPLHVSKTVFRTSFLLENVNHNLLIANDATLQNSTNKRSGTIIDIDTFKDNGLPNSFDDKLKDIIELCHNEEKKLFFSLLKQDFLKSLNPKY
jgi:uncharacterized protein (TIGR04255 family)